MTRQKDAETGLPSDLSGWQEKLDAAKRRCDEARRGVAEAAVDRLSCPFPGAYGDHRKALEEEVEALRTYRGLLAAYMEFEP